MTANYKHHLYPSQLENGKHSPNVKNDPIFRVELHIQESHRKLEQALYLSTHTDLWGLQTMGKIFFCYLDLFLP